MAIALVASASVVGANGGTTSAIDTTGATLLTLYTTWYSSGGQATISDSKGNTWTARSVADTYMSAGGRIYDCANPTVGSGHTFTATGSGTYSILSVSAFSGAKTSSPFDVQNNTNGEGGGQTSKTTGSVTPSEDNELLYACWVLSNEGTPGSPSVNSSFTLINSTAHVGGVSFGFATTYKVQTTAGAENPTLSWSGGAGAAGNIATYKAAAAAGIPHKLNKVSQAIQSGVW